ncbi:MAG: GerMN domain-containing protein [Bacilli bacterium]
MLRKIYLKKILISISALLALFLIYLIPTENRELKNIKSEVTYIDSSVETNNIYLLDSHNMVSLTNIMVSGEDIETKAKDLIESLIQGSTKEDQIPNGFKSIIPDETKILNLKLENNILKIDFSKDILNIKKELEEKMIEALTYTLTSIDGIDGIIIYVEGNLLNKLPQTNINLPSTLDRNFGINKEYDITSSKDITSVTTYYVSKNNDEYYYVPVTKYLNDDREKIKIVIDELESSKMYNTNLMSFLNNNVKLLSVEQLEDTLTLNFNEYIYSNLDTKEILEEVIYTICLSIEDNYDVKQIVFNVNDEEIYKSVLKSIE